MALVFGRAHPQFGQVPVAQVVLAGTTPDPAVLLEDLRVHCCRRLSPYKVPQDFAIVPELPRTPSGKLSRVEVRQARY